MKRYICPSCQSTDLEVTVEVWAKLTQAPAIPATWIYGDTVEVTTDTSEPDRSGHSWDENSVMECMACGNSGISETFEVKP